jgi:hypothetical protein
MVPATQILIVATVLAGLALAARAQAPIINRANVPAGYATPSGGTFSILFPIAFSDIAQSGDIFGINGGLVRMVTGITPGGTRLSAAEIPDANGELAPLEEFMGNLQRRLGAGATLSDVAREQKDGVQVLSFTLAAQKRGFYFRVMRHPKVQYVLLVQFPEIQRDEATAMKDAFFSSFSLARP